MNKYIIAFCVILCAAFAVAQGANTLVYLTDGGAKQVFSSGSTLQLDSGSTVTNAAALTQSGTVTQTGAVNQDSKLDILSGGEIEISSGATFEFVSGATWTMANGTIPRADLFQDDLVKFRVPLVTAIDPGTGGLVTATPAAGSFSTGALAGGAPGLIGEVADNETEASVFLVEFVLPENYVAGETISVSINVRWVGGEDVGVASTVDLSAFVRDDAGGVGADICATSAQGITSTFATKTFTLTPTSRVAGETIALQITTSVVDDAAGSTSTSEVDSVYMLVDVKG